MKRLPVQRRDFEQIDHLPPLRHRVFDQLEAMIISGDLQPGERLVESDLAQQLGVSRGPVREALQMLARDGWIELRARHGAAVRIPTRERVDDFYNVRRALEMESARAAALNITRDGVERLREALDRGRQIAEAAQQPLLVDYNEAGRRTLHEEIVHIGGNQQLINLVTLLTKRMVWYSTPLPITPDAWFDNHRAIVDAICDREPELAMQRMGEHIESARVEYQRHLSDLDGGGVPATGR